MWGRGEGGARFQPLPILPPEAPPTCPNPAQSEGHWEVAGRRQGSLLRPAWPWRLPEELGTLHRQPHRSVPAGVGLPAGPLPQGAWASRPQPGRLLGGGARLSVRWAPRKHPVGPIRLLEALVIAFGVSSGGPAPPEWAGALAVVSGPSCGPSLELLGGWGGSPVPLGVAVRQVPALSCSRSLACRTFLACLQVSPFTRLLLQLRFV